MIKERKRARPDGYYRVLTIGATPVYVRRNAFIYLGLCIPLLLLKLPATAVAIAVWLALHIVHETGHAIATRAFGGKVTAVFIHMYGGRCLFSVPAKLWQLAVVAGAGMMAQLLVLVAALIWYDLYGTPSGLTGDYVLLMLSAGNGYLILSNLVPHTFRSGMRSDGLLLWQIYLHAYRGGPHPFKREVVPPEQSPVFDPAISLLTKPELVPERFVSGIAFYNDAKTPMDFVIQILMAHLGLEKAEAARLMLDIHNKGGSLVPLSSRAQAEKIAAAIMAEAGEAGHPFTCCAVEAGGQAVIRSGV